MPNPPRGRRARRGPRAGNRARPLSPSAVYINEATHTAIAEGFAEGIRQTQAMDWGAFCPDFHNYVRSELFMALHTGDTMTTAVRPEPGTMWTPTYDVERAIRSTGHGNPARRELWTYTIYPGNDTGHAVVFDAVGEDGTVGRGLLVVDAVGVTEDFILVSGDIQLALSGDVDAVGTGEDGWRSGAIKLRVTMPRPPTDDPDLAARRAENDHRRARIIEERRERAAKMEGAITRAKETFLGFLTPDQRKQFPMGYITCKGSDGNTYRIDVDSTPVVNVHWLKDPTEPDELTGTYCAAPGSIGQPYYDMFLGQLMALTANAPGFLETANYSGGEWPPSRPSRRDREQEAVNITVDMSNVIRDGWTILGQMTIRHAF